MIDDSASRRPHRQRPVSILRGLGLAIRRRPGGVVPVRVMAGVQAGLLLLLLVGCATPDWRGHSQQAHDRQGIVVAHPAWLPEILGAVASGVICAGMSPDMVRAAWGRPAHLWPDGSGSSRRETWYYTRPQHAVDIIGGQAVGSLPSVYWTVLFENGWVVAWTD
jgi:hypothetical protein